MIVDFQNDFTEGGALAVPDGEAIAPRVSELLGEGGFGHVYLVRRLGRSAVIPSLVCIKVSERIDGWLREAYFGQLLDGHPRAIRVFEIFPLMRAPTHWLPTSVWTL